MNNQTPYIGFAYTPNKFGWHEEVINEDKNGKQTKAMVLEGEFQRADKPNRNKRVYSEVLLERETQKLQKFISERSGLPMAMDHPLPGESQRDLMLIQRMGMADTCALCTQLEMNNSVVYGKSRVLEGDHGVGDKLAALVRNGFKPGVSSRGMGGKPGYNTQGYIMVPEDYMMITYDYVTQPSTFNAILTEHINEQLILFENKINNKRKFYEVLIDLQSKYK